MLDIAEPGQRVHLILGPTDMRKSIDGLCALVKYFLEDLKVNDSLDELLPWNMTLS